MNSKKINQLATELTPSLSDLTIIGDPSTGVSKKITLSQMASLFTGTVEEYPSFSSFPLVGVADTIYIATDTNILYRWDTSLSAYAELSPNIVTSLVFSDANGFDGTISLVGSVATLTITTALTQGSVAFIGASGALSQDNDNFFWDDTNNRLGIGTKLPTTALDVFGSGIIGRVNGTSTNNAFLGFASAGTNKWSIGNVQSDHRFRIYSEANTSELVSVLQTGEFGIGIANPTTKLHIDGGSSALIANLDANVSVAKSISFRSDNSNRFNIEVSGTESGSNAGADLFVRRYSDAGALIDTPLTIVRSTGNATFIGTVTASNGTLIGGGGTTNYFSKFTNSNVIGNTAMYEGSAGKISINNTNTTYALEVHGEGRFYQPLTNTTAYFRVENNRSRNAALNLKTTVGDFLLGVGIGADTNQFQIYDNTAGANRLVISSTGAATFANTLTTGGTIQITGAGSPTTGAGLEMGYGNLTAGRTTITSYNRTGAAYIGNDYNALDYIWYTSGSQKMTLTNGGNIGINTSGNTTSTPHLFLGTNLSMFNGGSDDSYFGSNFYFNSAWYYRTSNAASMMQQDGGEFKFKNASSGTANAALTWVERGRFTTGGYFKATSTGSYYSSTGPYHEFIANGTSSNTTLFRHSGIDPYGLDIAYPSASPNGGANNFIYCVDSTAQRASIRSNGGIANYQANNVNLSDQRTKKDIIPLESYWNKFKAIEIVKFKYKDQTHDDFNIGVIAQQVEKVAPEFIDIDGWDSKPELDEEGNEIINEEEPLKSVYTTDLHHATIKVLQEAMAKIEVLEAKLNSK